MEGKEGIYKGEGRPRVGFVEWGLGGIAVSD